MRQGRVARQLAGFVMALGALTLFGASTIHFGVVVPLGVATVRDPFAGAAIPEAVLGVVLGAGAIIVLTGVSSWWRLGVAAITVAILVVLYGTSITLRAGRVGDVVYHSTLLVILLVAGIVLLRSRPHSAS